MIRRTTVVAFVVLASVASACGPQVDLKQAIQVTDVSSGWFDAGIQNGKNKLVPTVTFKLKKNPEVRLSSISLNLTFKFVGSEDHADDVYLQSVPFDGNETRPIVVRTQWGYTGDPPQTRAEMLKHSQFRDMEAQIFAKQSSSQWVELQRAPIARQLLTQ
ncbi:MAG TPA: hypothetical protein VFT39_03810 [Vicinamibacterales bacterium]|nr:hypothetical protein [Vicinamibacterales bacterium]